MKKIDPLWNSKNAERTATARLPAKFWPTLSLLLEASEYADLTSGDRWEYAIEIDKLHSLGLSENDLRLLISMKLVDHACEVTFTGQDGRKFIPTGSLTFLKRTCFVLTPLGIKVAGSSCRSQADNGRMDRSSDVIEVHQDLDQDLETKSDVPRWDSERRILSFNGLTVKQFKWSAANQEAILDVFEEEGWPARIDDPLPPKPEQDSKRRLLDTIKCLNRKQKNELIRFCGDGSGEGVTWKTVKPFYGEDEPGS